MTTQTAAATTTQLANINDIDYNTAYHAHYNTSFSPEKRAEQERNGYTATVNGFADHMRETVNNKDSSKLSDLEILLLNYKEGYLKRKLDQLHAKSRCLSWMITGPANFPTARADKANRSEHNKSEKLWDYQDNSQRYILKKLDLLTGQAINSDDEDAIQQLITKLATLERLQIQMKACNKVARSKKLSDDEKTEKLELLGLSLEIIKEMINPPERFRCYDKGYQHFELTNNNSKIKATKQRLEVLTALKSQDDQEKMVGNVLAVRNVEANRIQFYLERKPTPEEKDALKGRAFKYSPRAEYTDKEGNTYNGAWQRKRSGTANLKYAVQDMCKLFAAKEA